MSQPPLPMGTIACCCCNGPAAMKTKAGEVRISISGKAGGTLAVSLPICMSCANQAARSPDAAMELLRAAAPRLVAQE